MSQPETLKREHQEEATSLTKEYLDPSPGNVPGIENVAEGGSSMKGLESSIFWWPSSLRSAQTPKDIFSLGAGFVQSSFKLVPKQLPNLLNQLPDGKTG